MLFYLIFFKPFKGTLNNILNIFNEIIIFLCFGTVLLINLYSVSSNVMDILGYLLLALIAVGFVLCWVAMAISTVKAFQKKGKRKKKGKVNLNNSQSVIRVKTTAMDFKIESFEIEEARTESNSKIANNKREFS